MMRKHFPKPVFVLLASILALCLIIACRSSQPGAAISPIPIMDTPSLQTPTAQPQKPKSRPHALYTAAADPVLFFSDITSGSKSGNSDTSHGRTGLDGAIVTIWGRNLGETQGSSKVYANGVEAASYYSWGNAITPADLITLHP